MTKTKSTAPTAPADADCPWSTIEEDGSNLTVDQLPSVPFVRLADLFRRNITAPYANLYDLAVPQWRLFALMGYFSPVPLTTPKALPTCWGCEQYWTVLGIAGLCRPQKKLAAIRQ